MGLQANGVTLATGACALMADGRVKMQALVSIQDA